MKTSANKPTFLAVLMMGIMCLILFQNCSKPSKLIPDDLVNFKSTEVSRIEIGARISAAQKEISLSNSTGSWKVKIGSKNWVSANGDYILNFLGQLAKTKAIRLAGNGEDRWREYRVGALGKYIQLYNGEEQVLDIVIGNISIVSDNELYTYFRMYESKEVYTTLGLIGSSIQMEALQWRNIDVVKLKPEEVISVKISLPDSDSFVMTKGESTWIIDGVKCDSIWSNSFISTLRNIKNEFPIDDIDSENFSAAKYKSIVTLADGSMIIFSALPDPVHKWLVHSSQNPDVVFAAPDLITKIFPTKEFLMGQF